MIGYSDGGGFAVGVGPRGIEKGFIGTYAGAVDTHVVPVGLLTDNANIVQDAGNVGMEGSNHAEGWQEG